MVTLLIVLNKWKEIIHQQGIKLWYRHTIKYYIAVKRCDPYILIGEKLRHNVDWIFWTVDKRELFLKPLCNIQYYISKSPFLEKERKSTQQPDFSVNERVAVLGDWVRTRSLSVNSVWIVLGSTNLCLKYVHLKNFFVYKILCVINYIYIWQMYKISACCMVMYIVLWIRYITHCVIYTNIYKINVYS